MKEYEYRHAYKGRNILIAVNAAEAGLTLGCWGCWSFAWEGGKFGASLDVSSGVTNPDEAHRLLQQDVEFLIDRPEEYAKEIEVAQEVSVRLYAESMIGRRQSDETYQDILARAKSECGEGVEAFLEELWDHWAEG